MKTPSALTTSVGALALTIALFTGIALAMDGPPDGGMHRFGRHEHGGGFGTIGTGGATGHILKMMDKLDLTQEQRDKVWTILDATRVTMRPHIEALYEGRKQMKQLRGDNYDESAARKLADQQGKHLADMIFLKTQAHSKIHAVLTPEQRAKMDQFRHRWHMMP